MESKETNSKLTPEDNALNEAINSVYEKYGTNLSAFFRDVYEELTLKRQESSDAFDRSQTF